MNVAGHRISHDRGGVRARRPPVGRRGGRRRQEGRRHAARRSSRSSSSRPTSEPSDALGVELREHVANVIGPIARPKFLMFVPDLPKTRSGKIMRRLLRDIAEGRTLGRHDDARRRRRRRDDPRATPARPKRSERAVRLPAPEEAPDAAPATGRRSRQPRRRASRSTA